MYVWGKFKMKSWKRPSALGIALAALLLTVWLCGGALQAAERDIYKTLDILSDVITIIQRDYIEKIGSEKLIRDALRGMLASLDSYSHYVPPPEHKGTPVAGAPAEDLGTYGVEVSYKDNLLMVVAPIENGPAWKSGLRSGDLILKIGEEPVKEQSLAELVNQFRGSVSKELLLEVARRGERDFLDITLKPGKIDGPPATFEMHAEKIGRLRISRFDSHTAPRVADCLKKLNAAGVSGLVIDLRDCPAGDVGAAIAVAELIFPEGALIASLRGRAEGSSREFRSQSKPIFEKGPIVALINGGTSGAAEVLAGAFQGGKRGILMGQKSFGCAFEEGSFDLGDGSKIMMITAVYDTPAGDEIQDDGLDPDVEAPLPPLPPETPEEKKPEKKKVKEKEEDKLDPMVQRAIDLIKGIRIVDRS
jgi:carboxyl-terminal processing protease